jgi:hypothetical protein
MEAPVLFPRSRFLPAARTSLVLLTLAVGVGLTRCAPPHGPSGQVEAVEFISDHNLICRNTDDVLSGGRRYPDVEWTNAPRTNAPITHTGGEDTRIRARITLSLAGAPADTPYLLEGRSAEPALCFRGEGRLAGGDARPLEVEATAPLGRAVRKARARVSWSLTLDPGTPESRTLDLGDTGPHVVYVTLGTPRDTDDPLGVVTDARMEVAVARVAAALAAAGAEATPPRILHELMKEEVDYYLPARHYDRRFAWKVPESWRMQPQGASCISIVQFVELVCKMIGVEGTARTSAFYATAGDPFKSVRGGLGDPEVFKQGFFGERWQLLLIDNSNSNDGQAGGLGGVNYYEAALEYEYRGKKYYYPGGTSRVYDTPDQVLRIFRTLAWVRYDFGLRDWMVMEVAATYSPPGRAAPPSVPLP